jgi:hypothetical protein
MLSFLTNIIEYHWFVKYFLIQQILGIILVEWALKKMTPLMMKSDEDKRMAKMYPEFKRLDIDKV